MKRASKTDPAAFAVRTRRDDFAAFICEQLAGLRGLESRAMFGGHGLYAGGRFFGIVWHGSVYFKTSPETRGDYLAADAAPFRPRDKQALSHYYEVPANVIERRSELLAWARRAVALA